MYLDVNRSAYNRSTVSFASEEYYTQDDYPPEVCMDVKTVASTYRS